MHLTSSTLLIHFNADKRASLVNSVLFIHSLSFHRLGSLFHYVLTLMFLCGYQQFKPEWIDSHFRPVITNLYRMIANSKVG